MWAKERAVLESGDKFSFEGHNFMRAIFADDTKHKVLRKAAQVTGTTYAVYFGSWGARYKYRTGVAYYFPTDKAVSDLSKSRVTPILQFNKDLEATQTDAVGIKKIGRCYVYFRGMKTRIGVESIPVDAVIFDEMDGMSPKAREMALKRISHSDYGDVLELSNSSIPNYGIDAMFRRGTQTYWYCICPSCKKETCLQKEFPTKLGLEIPTLIERNGKVIRACKHCQAELDPTRGRWRSDYEGRDIHSYSMSQLLSTKVDPAEIKRGYEEIEHPEVFYSYVIGQPFETSEGRITEQEIENLCGDYWMEEFSVPPCSMGVDQGDIIYYVISRWEGGLRKYIKIGTCDNWDYLDTLMEAYRVSRCVVDARPEKRNAIAFAAKYPRRVFACYVRGDSIGSYIWNEEKQQVSCDKVEHLDASGLMIKNKKVVFPHKSTPIIQKLFKSQMASVGRKIVVNERTGEKRYQYVGLNQEGSEVAKNQDHFRHAFSYDVLCYDTGAAPSYGPLVARTRQSGIMSRYR
jgi:hypothetical protein